MWRAVVLTDPQYSKEFDVIGVAETTPARRRF